MENASIDERDMRISIAEVLNRWPTGGLAAGIIRNGSLEWFYGHGVADIESNTPVIQDTVFRIGDISKTFTAIAVMQLCEHGLVDIDAPANEYLRAFQLIPAKAAFRPVTLRHLLTHTAGIGEVRRLSDLLRPTTGSGVSAKRSVPSLAEYYRDGLRVEVEPGTKWAYADHGFAALGQVVEDVAGQPIGSYLREYVFKPLGMEHTDLSRSERVRSHLATGYVLRSHGLKAVNDRQIVTPGTGSAYSTTSDMARYVAALLNGGANEHGSVLKPETIAVMFAPQYQPDPRIPGIGLAFLRGEADGHRTVGHDGACPGFISQMVVAPDAGIGVVAFTNAGSRAPFRLGDILLRRMLGVSADMVRTDVPEHPEKWSDLCGFYGPDPGLLTNLRMRALVGAGIEVMGRRGHLMIRGLTAVPVVRKGFRLYPDDDDDPYVFRIDLSALGMGTCRVVFANEPEAGVTAVHLALVPMSLRKRSGVRNPRPWANGALAAGAAALAIRGSRAAFSQRSASRLGRSRAKALPEVERHD